MGKQLRRRFDRSLQRQQQRGGMSALPPIADIEHHRTDVRFVPTADIIRSVQLPV